MMIKIIDWSSRIIAVLLAIGWSFLLIYFAVATEGSDEFGWYLVIFAVVTGSFSQLGLFFAPVARHKGIIYRVIIAILMLPHMLIIIPAIVVIPIEVLSVMIGVSSWSMEDWSTKDTIGSVIGSIIITVYTTEFYLLFKGKKTKGNIQYEKNGKK